MLKKLSDTRDPEETKEVMKEVDDFITDNMSNNKKVFNTYIFMA